MKKLTRVLMSAALLSAVFGVCAANAGNAAGQTMPAASTNLDQVLANASASVDERVKAIDAYVSEVESKLQTLSRKEKVLKTEDLSSVTKATLEKFHAYYDGQNLKRVKAYHKGGSHKTEEFYFHNDRLVLVFIEAEGAGKAGHVGGAKGERLYFGNDGLLAWYGEDGKAKDTANSEFKAKGEKMLAEASAFRKLVG